MLTFRYSDPPKTDAEAKDSKDSGSIETKITTTSVTT